MGDLIETALTAAIDAGEHAYLHVPGTDYRDAMKVAIQAYHGAEAVDAERSKLCDLLQSLRPGTNPTEWNDWNRGIDHGLVVALQLIRGRIV